LGLCLDIAITYVLHLLSLFVLMKAWSRTSDKGNVVIEVRRQDWRSSYEVIVL
jgi:hypothetical protein